MRTLFVAGRFDDQGGRPSRIAGKIAYSMGLDVEKTTYVNGGTFYDLEHTLDSAEDYGMIYWFADVPDDKEKIVGGIKKRHKSCVLVTSKRNVDGKYSFQDLLYHALGIKSNLFVEFSKDGDIYRGRVIDPLGNVFLDYDADFGMVGRVLEKRSKEIAGYQRMHSQQIGDSIEIPDETDFFSIVRDYAEVFHNLIHAHPEATNRFFGNASFRCENGFPSFRENGIVYVSRRNFDKRGIRKESFVPVAAGLPVRYFGIHKPSVDTPVQLRLYDYYNNVRYMLHSHTYIRDAPFTGRVLPCGAVEEADEISKIQADKNSVNFGINIIGHGSLVLADNTGSLRGIEYVPRPMPEIHAAYKGTV